MKTKSLVTNAIVAALYVAITGILAPISFGALQFRVAEIFNHLIIFNRKYLWGIVGGVFISNLFFSTMIGYDLVFGVGHSLVSLVVASGLMRKKLNLNIWVKFSFNTLVFTVFSALIAWELYLAFSVPFWFGYLTVGIGELGIMAVGAPLMMFLDKKIHFSERIGSE
ncbi:QueT transporter family protein [Carnobacterium mobile]|uniref:QueT transporter family protein n=1 Tax=Carnobacterium mobile TaxID=2750 RepID=UPI0005560C57|nr:QueT transporter family protein [Carnobacterium mobile]